MSYFVSLNLGNIKTIKWPFYKELFFLKKHETQEVSWIALLKFYLIKKNLNQRIYYKQSIKKLKFCKMKLSLI